MGPSIAPSSAYAFASIEELKDVATGRADDKAYYRRYGHLNSVMLERAMAELENGPAALATVTGMSARGRLCILHQLWVRVLRPLRRLNQQCVHDARTCDPSGQLARRPR